MKEQRKGRWKSFDRWDSVPKWYKKMRVRIRRHRDKDSVRRGEDVVKHKKDDKWNWL